MVTVLPRRVADVAVRVKFAEVTPAGIVTCRDVSESV